MAFKIPLALLGLMAMMTTAMGQGSDNWIKQVLTLGEEITFSCTENGTWPVGGDYEVPENSTIVGWMYPRFKIVNTTYNDGKRQVLEDGEKFRVVNITREDFGVYHCVHRKPDGELFLVKWGLNMKGPYFEDLWEKYRMNTIIGLSAAGGFTVLAVAVVLIWTYRWQAPEDSFEQESDLSSYRPSGLRAKSRKDSPGIINGYDNTAFTPGVGDGQSATVDNTDDSKLSSSMRRYYETPYDGKTASTQM